MKRLSSALITILLSLPGIAQNRDAVDFGRPPLSTAATGVPIVGEKFSYEVSWADFLVAGELTIETRDRRLIDGVDAFHVVAQAESVGLVRLTALKVNDVYESFLNARTLEPFRAEKQVRHGKKREQASVTIDQKGKSARLSSGETLQLKAPTYDLAGLLVALRTLDFKSNRPKMFTLLDDGKLYDLQVEVEGREKVNTRAGSYDCVRLVTKAIGRTKSDPYRLRVFISEDARRLPVMITAEPPWGSVRVELTSMSGVGGIQPARAGKPA
jgi:hypothetical protein